MKYLTSAFFPLLSPVTYFRQFSVTAPVHQRADMSLDPQSEESKLRCLRSGYLKQVQPFCILLLLTEMVTFCFVIASPLTAQQTSWQIKPQPRSHSALSLPWICHEDCQSSDRFSGIADAIFFLIFILLITQKPFSV